MPSALRGLPVRPPRPARPPARCGGPPAPPAAAHLGAESLHLLAAARHFLVHLARGLLRRGLLLLLRLPQRRLLLLGRRRQLRRQLRGLRLQHLLLSRHAGPDLLGHAVHALRHVVHRRVQSLLLLGRRRRRVRQQVVAQLPGGRVQVVARLTQRLVGGSKALLGAGGVRHQPRVQVGSLALDALQQPFDGALHVALLLLGRGLRARGKLLPLCLLGLLLRRQALLRIRRSRVQTLGEVLDGSLLRRLLGGSGGGQSSGKLLPLCLLGLLLRRQALLRIRRSRVQTLGEVLDGGLLRCLLGGGCCGHSSGKLLPLCLQCLLLRRQALLRVRRCRVQALRQALHLCVDLARQAGHRLGQGLLLLLRRLLQRLPLLLLSLRRLRRRLPPLLLHGGLLRLEPLPHVRLQPLHPPLHRTYRLLRRCLLRRQPLLQAGGRLVHALRHPAHRRLERLLLLRRRGRQPLLHVGAQRVELLPQVEHRRVQGLLLLPGRGGQPLLQRVHAAREVGGGALQRALKARLGGGEAGGGGVAGGGQSLAELRLLPLGGLVGGGQAPVHVRGMALCLLGEAGHGGLQRLLLLGGGGGRTGSELVPLRVQGLLLRRQALLRVRRGRVQALGEVLDGGLLRGLLGSGCCGHGGGKLLPLCLQGLVLRRQALLRVGCGRVQALGEVLHGGLLRGLLGGGGGRQGRRELVTLGVQGLVRRGRCACQALIQVSKAGGQALAEVRRRLLQGAPLLLRRLLQRLLLPIHRLPQRLLLLLGRRHHALLSVCGQAVHALGEAGHGGLQRLLLLRCGGRRAGRELLPLRVHQLLLARQPAVHVRRQLIHAEGQPVHRLLQALLLAALRGGESGLASGGGGGHGGGHVGEARARLLLVGLGARLGLRLELGELLLQRALLLVGGGGRPREVAGDAGLQRFPGCASVCGGRLDQARHVLARALQLGRELVASCGEALVRGRVGRVHLGAQGAELLGQTTLREPRGTRWSGRERVRDSDLRRGTQSTCQASKGRTSHLCGQQRLLRGSRGLVEARAKVVQAQAQLGVGLLQRLRQLLVGFRLPLRRLLLGLLHTRSKVVQPKRELGVAVGQRLRQPLARRGLVCRRRLLRLLQADTQPVQPQGQLAVRLLLELRDLLGRLCELLSRLLLGLAQTRAKVTQALRQLAVGLCQGLR